MKRIISLAMALLMLFGCTCAEEIGEMVINQPPAADPNEISEQGAKQTEQYETAGLDWVTEPVPATEPIEEPAVVTEPIEEPVVEPITEPVTESVEAPAVQAAASGETAVLKNVELAVPAGWRIVNTSDDTQNGGGLSVSMINASASAQMQADSRPVEGIKNAVVNVGAEAVLSNVVVGTMQAYGVVIDTYDFLTLKGDIPCVKTCQVVSMSSNQATSAGEYTMGIAAMLDDSNMVVVIQVLPGSNAEDGMALLNVVLSPMMQ